MIYSSPTLNEYDNDDNDGDYLRCPLTMPSYKVNTLPFLEKLILPSRLGYSKCENVSKQQKWGRSMYLSPINCKMYLCQTFECICQPKIDMFEVSVLRWWAGRRAAGEPALPSHDQRVLHWYTHLRIHTHLFVTIFPIITPTIFPIITPTIIPTIFPITILMIDTQTLTTSTHLSQNSQQ